MKKQGIFAKLFAKITAWLMREKPSKGSILSDFDKLRYEIKPGDVLLIAGRSRVSEVIKLITQSHWSHSALYIGRLHDFEDPKLHEIVAQHYRGPASAQLLVESVMGKGTIITTLERYKHMHSRICRPTGISRHDVQRVISYAIQRLGGEYDVRQIFDLARFLFPWGLFPRRWRSSLFRHNAGVPTKQSCSSLIGEAFTAVSFPILPFVKAKDGKDVEFVHRIPRLFTPSDFDFSPYFDIIKYPVLTKPGKAIYHHLPWSKENVVSDKEGTLYKPEVEEGEAADQRESEETDKNAKENASNTSAKNSLQDEDEKPSRHEHKENSDTKR